jgi:hypothetical protein
MKVRSKERGGGGGRGGRGYARERAIYSGYARIRQVIIDSYTNQKRIPAATTNEQNNGGGGGGSGY